VTTLLDRPAPTLPVDHRRAMLALARVESVRLLRHPLVLAASVLFLGPWIFFLANGDDRYPTVRDAALELQFLVVLLFGSAVMVAANLTALRAHRHHVDEFFGVLTLPRSRRTAGLLLALLPTGGLVTALVLLRLGVSAALPGAAGRPHWAEVLASPVLVLLLGAIGVLLAVLVRSVVVAPVGVLAILVLFSIGGVASAPGRPLLAMLPVQVRIPPYALPAGLVDRPSTAHLAYLVGLTLLVAVGTLLRAGARGGVTYVAAGLAGALAVGGVAAQLPENTAVVRARAAAVDAPAPLHTCRTVDDVTYCAFDDFAAWTDAWADVVRAVRRPVPDSAVTGPPLAVRQRIPADDEWLAVTGTREERQAKAGSRGRDDRAAGMPEAVAVGTDWSARAAAAFAASVAYRLISGTSADDGDGIVCGARGALVVWLAGQVGGRVAAGLREADESSWGSLMLMDPVLSGVQVSVPDTDAASGLALLKRPTGEVTALVRRHWADLTDPAAGVDRFAALLGVPAAPQPPVEERIAACAS
jgi:hypothetical protein